MKLIGAILTAAVICGVVLTAGCINESENQPLVGTWVLNDDNRVTLTFENDGTFNGHAQINSYGGSYTAAGSSLSLGGNVYRTLMGGSSIDMASEDEYLKDLTFVTSYTVVGSELKLFDKDGRVLFIFKQNGTPEVSDDIIPKFAGDIVLPDSMNWQMVSNPKITLSFDTDGNYGGQAPVNKYSGTYSLRASEAEPQGFVVLSDPFRTKMGGTEADMSMEDTFFRALPKVVSYTIESYADETLLNLMDANGRTILAFAAELRQ